MGKIVYGSEAQRRGHKERIKQKWLTFGVFVYGFAIAYGFTFGIEVGGAMVIIPAIAFIISEVE